MPIEGFENKFLGSFKRQEAQQGNRGPTLSKKKFNTTPLPPIRKSYGNYHAQIIMMCFNQGEKKWVGDCFN